MYVVNKENNIRIMRDRFTCDLDFVKHFVRNKDDGLEAEYGPYRLTSHFQPIFSLAHQDVVGYEGLVRAHNRSGEELQPVHLFERGRVDFDEIFLDRLSRYLHSHNFSRLGNRRDWLFLNVSPKVIVSGKRYGDYFASLLTSAGIDPGRVVIEIVEQEIEDEQALAEAAEYYRSMGCLIAIDDFGKGHSNFSRIWQLKPEIVKLDRSLIVQASSNISSQVLSQLVSLIHESGSLVLVEGIETDSEALLAINSGADFVQGYYFARPDNHLHDPEAKRLFRHLCDMYRQNAEHELARSHESDRQYSALLTECASKLTQGQGIKTASTPLLSMPYVKRCYLLDDEGWLWGEVNALHGKGRNGAEKFFPIRREKGMVWSQWREFLKARELRGEVHMGAQHLSVNDGKLSRTLSINVMLDDREYLLCCDIDVQGLDLASRASFDAPAVFAVS